MEEVWVKFPGPGGHHARVAPAEGDPLGALVKPSGHVRDVVPEQAEVLLRLPAAVDLERFSRKVWPRHGLSVEPVLHRDDQGAELLGEVDHPRAVRAAGHHDGRLERGPLAAHAEKDNLPVVRGRVGLEKGVVHEVALAPSLVRVPKMVHDLLGEPLLRRQVLGLRYVEAGGLPGPADLVPDEPHVLREAESGCAAKAGRHSEEGRREEGRRPHPDPDRHGYQTERAPMPVPSALRREPTSAFAGRQPCKECETLFRCETLFFLGSGRARSRSPRRVLRAAR